MYKSIWRCTVDQESALLKASQHAIIAGVGNTRDNAGVLNSAGIWAGPHRHCWEPPTVCKRNQNMIFQHLGSFFLAGTLKMSPAVSMSPFSRGIQWDWPILRVRNSNGWPSGPDSINFREESTVVGLAMQARNSNGWPTGPVSTNFREESTLCINSGIGEFCRLEIPTDDQLAQVRSLFERSLLYSGNGRFCRLATPTDGQLASFDFTCSKFQRMANWPSFDFLIETGPVGHPLEFRACKSAKPTIDSSRKSQISH